MKLLAARAVAESIAEEALGGSSLPCGRPSTGLLVLVYRDDDQDIIAGAKVQVSGQSVRLLPPGGPRQKGTAVRKPVTGKPATTDANGIARYLPFDPGKYKVEVAALPSDPDKLFRPPGGQDQPVAAGSCPICSLRVRVLARPEVEVVAKHDGSGIQGVRVQLEGKNTYAFAAPTGANGVSSWPDSLDPIEPGPYAVRFTFPGAGKHELFDEQDRPVKNASIDVPPGRKRFRFKARRLSWAKLKVVLQGAGDEADDVEKAKIAIKWPEDGSLKPFETARAEGAVLAHIQDMPVPASGAATFDVESVEVPDEEGEKPSACVLVEVKTG